MPGGHSLKTKIRFLVISIFIVSCGLFGKTTDSLSAELSPEQKSQILFQRLTGNPLRLNDPRLAQMATLLSSGKKLEAAKIAMSDEQFYSLTLKKWAAPMSSQTENPVEPFNDMQAMMIGVVRDDLDARLLLTGNFTYVGKTASLPQVSEINNNHYDQIATLRLPLSKELVKQEPQRKDLTYASGILTSRAWASAHYNAGTNRRALQYLFSQFLCTPIDKWKDFGLADFRVRRDVDRKPGGNPETYQTLCRSCHAAMDGLTGAFASVDFVNNRFFYLQSGRIANKMNQNAGTYPFGYRTVDDSWINLATQNHNQEFGWRGSMEGMGLQSLADMVANSEAFSRCMVERAYKEVCQRAPMASENKKIRDLAFEFEGDGYKLKNLFAKVAVESACLDI